MIIKKGSRTTIIEIVSMTNVLIMRDFVGMSIQSLNGHDLFNSKIF